MNYIFIHNKDYVCGLRELESGGSILVLMMHVDAANVYTCMADLKRCRRVYYFEGHVNERTETISLSLTLRASAISIYLIYR